GRIWVGTPKELAFWDGKKFSNMTPTNGESGINVLHLAPAVDGGIWVRTPGWLRKCDNRHWSVEASLANLELKESQFPLWIYPDIQGGAWLIKYGSGLWHVDLSGKVSNIGLDQGLPSNLIECWLQDREGNMWVGLVGGGLACVRQRVFHVVWPSKLQTALATRSVCQNTNGEMWFGTSGDSVLQWADGKFDKRTPPQDKIAGADTTVCSDGQGRMWVGTVQNGVWIFETNSFRRPFSSEEIGTVVRALFCDHLGRMWIGNEFGLYCWDHERLKRFTAADGFAPAYVLAITEDDAGTLWLGTAVGELRSYRDGKFTAYRPADALGARHAMARENSVNAESTARGSLSGGERFWAIHADHQGILWIGTLGGGLLRFKDGHFARYTTLQGLPNEHVSQILEDGRGQFWLGTRSGITRITRAALEAYAQGKIETIPFATYGKFDGLPTIECSGGYQPSCWAGTDGRLWFATLKGAVWVNPETLPFNPLPPPVWLEEMRVDKKVVYEMHSEPRSQTKLTNQLRRVIRPDTGSLQIAAGQHFYEFKFTALSLVSPDKVRFKWRLHGAEQEW
ncbi:MAG: two-component regulator propeller domain-containing protein, partial [Verrucomicrobiota bacterium]